MSHLRLLYYALVAVVGVVALVLSAFGIIRSRVPAYWYLFGFYAGFTMMVGVVFLREYLFLNVDQYSILAVYRTFAAASVVETLFLASLAFFLHRLAAVQAQPVRDFAVAVIAISGTVLEFVPGAVSLDIQSLTINFGFLYSVTNILYIILFGYVLLLTGWCIRRDRPPRELVLIIALLVFSIIGFAESFGGVLGSIRVSHYVISPGEGPFIASTIPYLLFGFVLIYFFGTYLLAEIQPAGSLDDSFVRQFGITPREAEVIDLMNRGMSNREIGEKLYVSLATVKSHAHNVYEKTGASSRYDLHHLVHG